MFHTKGFAGKDGHDSGHITQWDRDTATWHSWNCGIAFYPLDLADELSYAKSDCGGQGEKKHYDRFYVKLKVRRHSLDHVPCSLVSTSTTATTTTTSVTTNTLKQAVDDLMNGGMQDTVAKHVQELMEAQIEKSEASIQGLQDEMKKMRADFAAQIAMFVRPSSLSFGVAPFPQRPSSFLFFPLLSSSFLATLRRKEVGLLAGVMLTIERARVPVIVGGPRAWCASASASPLLPLRLSLGLPPPSRLSQIWCV